MGKLTIKGRHIVKVESCPHINMISESAIMRRVQMQNIENAFEIRRPVTQNSEKAMAIHSSTLAWQIPWIEKPGRLQSMVSLGVGHD